jgi:hypothetical protein
MERRGSKKMKHRRIQRGRKGLLVKGFFEKAPSKLFELLAAELKDLLKDKAGIYVLYQDNELYYAGLTKNLEGRLRGHLENRNKGKWNNFSLYVIKRTNYLQDLETLILRLTKPKGNIQKGRFPKDFNLRPKIMSRLKEFAKAMAKMKRE